MSKKEQTDAPEVEEPPAGEAAEIAEAEGAKTITVTWNEKEWTVPANYGLVDAVAFRGIIRLQELANGAAVTEVAEGVDVIESLLGRVQFRTWARGDRATVGDAFDLIAAIFAAWGTSSGESPASM